MYIVAEMDRVAEFKFVIERTRDGIARAGIKSTIITTSLLIQTARSF